MYSHSKQNFVQVYIILFLLTSKIRELVQDLIYFKYTYIFCILILI